MRHSGARTGVMLKKAVCVGLFAAVPGFLGYPAAVNVDPIAKIAAPAAESGDLETWPLPTTTVVSLQPRWLALKGPMAHRQAPDGEVLTKEVQRQLRRLGCYSGEINGAWNRSTRRAMQTFIHRVNAMLPVDRADHVLLALLQNHPDNTCNKPCPLGEDPAPDGRCVPVAIARLVVKAPSQPLPRIASWTAVETAALEDDISKLQRSKPSQSSVRAGPMTPPPAPRSVVTPKRVADRPMTGTDREPPRHWQRSERVSQRAERQVSRPVQRSEFVRSVFQRAFDSSLR